MPKVLTAADLIEDANIHEVAQAFAMLQKGTSPDSVIHTLRGEVSQLLDPDQFAIEVQQRFEGLELQKARAKAAGTQQLPLSSLHGCPPSQDHFPAR